MSPSTITVRPYRRKRSSARIRDGGGRAAVGADVSDAEECARMFVEIDEAFGGLDILVSNAGMQADAALTEMTLTQWRQVIDVNLTGAFLCAQHAVRRLRARSAGTDRTGATGNIIFVSSVHELIPWAGHANYSASKGGLNQLMRSLAQELAPEGIRLNAIAPGAIKTPINAEAWDTPEAAAQLLKLIPYGRIGSPDDVARAAVWLASEASDYVVGSTLFVDGDMSLSPAENRPRRRGRLPQYASSPADEAMAIGDAIDTRPLEQPRQAIARS